MAITWIVSTMLFHAFKKICLNPWPKKWYNFACLFCLFPSFQYISICLSPPFYHHSEISLPVRPPASRNYLTLFPSWRPAIQVSLSQLRNVHFSVGLAHGMISTSDNKFVFLSRLQNNTTNISVTK